MGVGLASAMRETTSAAILPRPRGPICAALRRWNLLYWGGDERGSDFSGRARISQLGSDRPKCATRRARHAFRLRRERAPPSAFSETGRPPRAISTSAQHRRRVASAARHRDQQQPVGDLGAARSQSAAETLAQKAIAAGIPRDQVDGNDVSPCASASQEAARRARGRRPASLIEAVTYRLGDHTTADDARRYRDAAEVTGNGQNDPVARLREHLVARGVESGGKERVLAERRPRWRQAAEAYLATRPSRSRPCSTTSSQSCPRQCWQNARRRSRKESAVAERNLVEAINLALARAMEEDSSVVILGEDVGRRRRLQGDRRAARALRQRARAGYAACRGCDRRRVGGHGGAGLPPGCGNPVHGLRLQRDRSAPEPRLASAHAHARPPLLPDGPAHAVRRRHPRARASFRKRGGVLRQYSGPARGRPVLAQARLRLLLAAIRDPDPVVFLEPTRIYRSSGEEVADSGEAMPLDVCFTLREGSDVTLVGWGAMLNETRPLPTALRTRNSC